MEKNRLRQEEEQTEQWLKQMPTIKDERSPEEIYFQITKKMKEQQPKRKKRMLLLPSLASVAVVFILLLTIPTMLSQNGNEASLADEDMNNEVSMMMEAVPNADSGNSNNMERMDAFTAVDDGNSISNQRYMKAGGQN